MKNKIIFCLALFLLTCSMERSQTLSPLSQESKCEYSYFINKEGKRDSTIISCPDPKPPKGP